MTHLKSILDYLAIAFVVWTILEELILLGFHIATPKREPTHALLTSRFRRHVTAIDILGRQEAIVFRVFVVALFCGVILFLHWTRASWLHLFWIVFVIAALLDHLLTRIRMSKSDPKA